MVERLEDYRKTQILNIVSWTRILEVLQLMLPSYSKPNQNCKKKYWEKERDRKLAKFGNDKPILNP